MRHRNRIDLGRRRFAASQQLSRVLAFFRGTSEVLSEAAGFQLHILAASIAFEDGTVVTLDLECSGLDFESGAIRVVSANVQLATLVDEIAVHCGSAGRAMALIEEQTRLALAILICAVDRLDFVPRNQVDGALATLLRRKRVTRATEKHAGTRGSNLHGSPALRTRNIRIRRRVRPHALDLVLGCSELGAEILVEITEDLLPFLLAHRDFIERFFEAGCEAVVHQIFEILNESLCHDLAHFFGVETSTVEAHITAILNRGNDRCVGRRATDSALFQFLDEACFAESRRRLREVLTRVELLQIDSISDLDVGQSHIGLTRLAGRRLHSGVPVEDENAAPCLEFEISSANHQAARQVFGTRHLTRHELAPDQIVESLLITLETLNVTGFDLHARRPNRFMGFLRARLARIGIGRFGQIFLTEVAPDQYTARFDCVFREIRRIGSHVRDVSRFVEPLGQHHRLLDAESEACAGCLLKRRSDIGRARPSLRRLVLALGDLEIRDLEQTDGCVRLLLTRGSEILTVLLCDLETQWLLGLRPRIRVNLPELLGDKGANFLLALGDQSYGHRLDAPC